MPAENEPNRLGLESSPYLRLHALNPVDWYPWGEEAFARARAEDRPIFLSIGYSTCYWCHVMERECFSNEEIARQLNDAFVSIKLDREERPDLDEIYMAATQLMTRSGGWPNSVFLTHDLKPFFAGTYFPPRDAMGRPGFPRVLAALRETWALRRGEILAQAEAVADAMREQIAAVGSSGTAPDPQLAERLTAALQQRFDRSFGGFGHAPKFPSPSNLSFLLARAQGGDGLAREMLVVTLDRMARGGLQDQLAGGFHRYSTDETWLVPHFEKMLYDNAALAPLYAEAAELAPGKGFERVARAILDFVLRELHSPEGGFLSAIDAETNGHEGAYYTWTADELRRHLAGDHDLFASVYGLEGRPNFEEDRYVLSLPVPFSEAASTRGLSEAELEVRLAAGKAALLRARGERPRPLVDDKVLTDWNGLMIGGMARAGVRLGEARYVEAAAVAARFVLDRLASPASPTLLHVYREGRARVPAFLDDYAFLVQGLLSLADATEDEGWTKEAVRLQTEQDDRLLDPKDGGYFAAGDDEHLLLQTKPAFDGALASGNGVSATNLFELFRRTGDDRYRERALQTLAAFADTMAVAPLGHVTLVGAMARVALPPVPRAAGAGPGPEAPSASALVASAPLEDLEDTAREVVSVVARLLPGGEGFRAFTVELDVRSGWHLNANPSSAPALVPTKLGAVLGRLRNVRYPEGQALAAGGEPLLVYHGRVQITGEIAAPEAGAPSLELTYQACDDRRCLPSVARLVRFT